MIHYLWGNRRESYTKVGIPSPHSGPNSSIKRFCSVFTYIVYTTTYLDDLFCFIPVGWSQDILYQTWRAWVKIESKCYSRFISARLYSGFNMRDPHCYLSLQIFTQESKLNRRTMHTYLQLLIKGFFWCLVCVF